MARQAVPDAQSRERAGKDERRRSMPPARQQAASGAQSRERAGKDERRRSMPLARQQAASDAQSRERAGKDERRLGAGLLALGAGYLAAAFLISEPEGGYAAVGPRVFPIGIGIALVAVALSTALRARARGTAGAPSSNAPNAQAGAGRARAPAADEAGAQAIPAPGAVPPAADWRAAAPSVLLFLAYIVLLEPLGYLPATTAFIVLEARLLGSRRWGRDLLAALVVTVSVYALFSLLLGLRLPAGLLGP